MSWIKKVSDVEVQEELNYENNSVSKTDAYETTITDAHIQESSDVNSKSISLVLGLKTDDGETCRTRFTLTGRNGETYYIAKVKGKDVKRMHFGLSSSNTIFGIILGKEIFDIEPSEVQYEQWDYDDKEMKTVTGDGFPELIGKKIGATIQMHRKIDGQDSKEYSQAEHFFNLDTGLFYNEEDSSKRKLDKWLNNAKEFKVEIVEQQEKRSSFGNKKATSDGEEAPKKNKWGRQ